MNVAMSKFRPSLNWVSAVLLTVFVLSFGIFAENHVRSGVINGQAEAAFCADAASSDKNLFFVRYH